MRFRVGLSIVLSAFIVWSSICTQCLAQATVIRKGVKEIVEALGSHSAKRGGREIAEEIAELGGEAVVKELVDRTVREGGDDALAALLRLTRAHGPDAIRAAANAPSIPAVLRAVDELPAELADQAVRRLAAGYQGRVLAETVEKYGAAALRAEVKHPGVGGQLVRGLGNDGAEIASRLTTPDAIVVARHAQNIADLPPDLRNGVLRLLHDDLERMVAWMGRFADRNPGKVLITAATTAVVLANADQVLGGSQVAFDADGKPYILEKPGMIDRTIDKLLAPIMALLAIVLPIIAIGATLRIAQLLWHKHKSYQIIRASLSPSPSRTGPGKTRSKDSDGSPC